MLICWLAKKPFFPLCSRNLVSGSVVSNCLQFHGLGPTRLLHPWDFPGKNIGVGCYSLLQGTVRKKTVFVWLKKIFFDIVFKASACWLSCFSVLLCVSFLCPKRCRQAGGLHSTAMGTNVAPSESRGQPPKTC